MGARLRLAGALLLVAVAVSPVRAQVPAGNEFPVSTATLDERHSHSAVGAAPDGRFVIVWGWSNFSGTRVGVGGRRFDAQGARVGGEFQVSAYTTGQIRSPEVAADADGFTIAWWQPETGSAFNVGARRYTWDGTPITPELVVNSSTTTGGSPPGIAADAAGNFVVVWAGGPAGGERVIWAQRFDAQGVRRGAELAVSAPTSTVDVPAVAMDGAGNFVVAWQDNSPAGEGIALRRFAADGTPLGERVQVATAGRSMPELARSPQGDFVVAWLDRTLGTDHLFAGRKFQADGTPSTPVLVLDDGANWLTPMALTMDASGGFAVSWTLRRDGARLLDVLLRRFHPDGTPNGPSVQANQNDQGEQFNPGLAATPAGHLFVAWSSAGTSPLSPSSIYGRRYAAFDRPFDPMALRVDTVAGAASNGNGVLEVGEIADVRPAWRNNSGQPLSMTGTLGFGGPPGATYVTEDPLGSYGTVGGGETASCTDCYAVRVMATQRPSVHWDATGQETVAAGDQSLKLWFVHVGGSFADVPAASPFLRFIETLLHRGVTAGCGATTYCRTDAVSREQMSVFVLRSKETAGYVPPACTTPVFDDVPASSPYCPWIEELARRGVSSGCGGPNFCPGAAVSREQMAVFLLRTLDPALNPPACTTPVFGDVPASSPFCKWIEELVRRGVTAGCGGGNYCPASSVTREQMAVFLTTTFGLSLYGP